MKTRQERLNDDDAYLDRLKVRLNVFEAGTPWLLTITYGDKGSEATYRFRTEAEATEFADDIQESMDTSEVRETGFCIELIGN